MKKKAQMLSYQIRKHELNGKEIISMTEQTKDQIIPLAVDLLKAEVSVYYHEQMKGLISEPLRLKAP